MLSFGIPFALVPLVLLTCRRDVTGARVNRRVTTIFAWSRAVMIIGMNIFLICQQPFLSSDTPLPSTASQTPFRSSTAPGHTSVPFRYQSPDEDSARWLGFPF